MARSISYICVLAALAVVAMSQDIDSSTTTTTTTAAAISTTKETTSSSTTTTTTTTTPSTTSSTAASIEATSKTATTTATTNTTRKYLSAAGLPTCKRNNADFSDCVKHIFEVAFQRFKDGDKDLSLPAIDPFQLNRTIFRYSNGPISGRILMRDAQVHGFAQLQFSTFDLKVNDGQIKMHVVSLVPEVHIVGNYKAELVVNNVRLRPRGDFNITLFNVTIDQSSEGDFYERDGHRFVHLTKFDANPKVGDFKFMATGIFPDPTLNEIASSVINQSWRQIFRVFLPETRQYWAPMLLRVINEAMSVVPYDEFVDE